MKNATNKVETIVAAAATAAPAVVVQAAQTKAAIAREVFGEMHKDGAKPQRKDVIKAICDKAKISEKGAATYYQTCKEKAGMVQKRAAVPAENGVLAGA